MPGVTTKTSGTTHSLAPAGTCSTSLHPLVSTPKARPARDRWQLGATRGSGTVSRVTAPHVSRRALLGLTTASLAAIAVGGCSDDAPRGAGAVHATTATTPTIPTETSATSQDGDVALVAAAITDEHGLVMLMRQARLAHRELAAQLDPVIAVGRRHVHTLTAAMDETVTIDTLPPAALPRSAPAAVRVLQQALLAAQLRRSSDCVAASSGAVASLMASIGAAHAASASVLATADLGGNGRRG